MAISFSAALFSAQTEQPLEPDITVLSTSPNAFHSPEMDTKQRILIAYFCVREAAKYDPRVGGNIEVALITEERVRLFSQDELAEVERASKEIAGWIARRFAAPGPPITGL